MKARIMKTPSGLASGGRISAKRVSISPMDRVMRKSGIKRAASGTATEINRMVTITGLPAKSSLASA